MVVKILVLGGSELFVEEITCQGRIGKQCVNFVREIELKSSYSISIPESINPIFIVAIVRPVRSFIKPDKLIRKKKT